MLQGEHSAILSTFIKLPFVIKMFVLSIFERPLKTGFTLESGESINPLHAGLFFMLMLLSADFFFLSKLTISKNFFQENYQCQNVWIQIRKNILWVLIWVQTVCKDYQHITKDATSKEKLNTFLLPSILSLFSQQV